MKCKDNDMSTSNNVLFCLCSRLGDSFQFDHDRVVQDGGDAKREEDPIVKMHKEGERRKENGLRKWCLLLHPVSLPQCNEHVE